MHAKGNEKEKEREIGVMISPGEGFVWTRRRWVGVVTVVI